MNRLQRRTDAWLAACFPEQMPIEQHREERGLRLVEEAVELGQAIGITREQAHRLVDYVFDRPVGEVRQEIGGVALTLSAVASVSNASVEECWHDELSRVMLRIEETRAKQQAKARQGIVAARARA